MKHSSRASNTSKARALILTSVFSGLVACGGGGGGGGESESSPAPNTDVAQFSDNSAPTQAALSPAPVSNDVVVDPVISPSPAPSATPKPSNPVATPTSSSDMPVGIPVPSFGWGFDTNLTPTVYVDNTHPNCDNSGGTQNKPLCHIITSGRNGSFAAGDVVLISGGPYLMPKYSNITLNGTSSQPVVLLGNGAERITFQGNGTDKSDINWYGQYAIVENLDFFLKTHHKVNASYFVARNIAVRNPENVMINFNPIVSVKGHDVTIHDSEIFNNMRDNDLDSHGIQASQGSYNVWIIDNQLHRNNGDAFQACHYCFSAPPHHIYLGRNTMYDNRENGIDLKTVHDVVISENIIYGHQSSSTSIGDAVVIGSNGFDNSKNQGPRRVWVINNDIRDGKRGIRIEGSEDVWIMGNTFASLDLGLRIDRKKHRDITVVANTFSDIDDDAIYVDGCNPRVITLKNNVFSQVNGDDVNSKTCKHNQLAYENNFFQGQADVLINQNRYSSATSLNGQSSAASNAQGNPDFDDTSLVPSASSPLIAAGASLDAIYSHYLSTYNLAINVDQAGFSRSNPETMGAFTRP